MAPPPMPADPILVAYDGSPSAKAAVEAAARLAPGHPAVVACVWSSFEEEAPAAVLAIPGGMAREAARQLDDAQREAAVELAAEGAELARRAGLDARPETRKGRSPSLALRELADELGAVAIAVGARGRTTLAAAFLGSTSHALVQGASRPVLVVHEPVEDG